MLSVKALGGLDESLAAAQSSLEQLSLRQTSARDEQAQEMQQRRGRLRDHLKANQASAVGELTPEAHVQLVKTAKAREFGSITRQLDALTKEFSQSGRPSLVAKMRPLWSQLEALEFPAALELLKAEIAAQLVPAQDAARAELRTALGPDWPAKAPSSLDFVAALERSLQLDLFEGTLAAFDVMAEPIDVRVKFNFESGQKTQRYDKPEWLFYFFGKMLDPHLAWLKSTVQPLVAACCAPGKFALDELITSVLPSFFRAAKLYLHNSTSDPELLRPFLTEAFKFDSDLRTRYFYTFGSGWPGFASSLLKSEPPAFDKWVEYESHSAYATFSELVDGPTAWDIDYDSTDARITSRATVLTLGVTALFDSITELYAPLEQQLQLPFFNLQIALVDKYLQVLKRHKNHPQADLDDYGKVLGSVGYFIDFLQHRNMHLVFIELKQPLRLGAESGLFDEMIANLNKFRGSCLEETNVMMSRALKKLFKGSQFVGAPLENRLRVFEAICNPVDYSSIVYSLSNSLGQYFWTNGVQASTYTPSQGAALRSELDEVWTTLALPRTSAFKRVHAAAAYFETGDTSALDAEDAAALQRRRVA